MFYCNLLTNPPIERGFKENTMKKYAISLFVLLLAYGQAQGMWPGYKENKVEKEEITVGYKKSKADIQRDIKKYERMLTKRKNKSLENLLRKNINDLKDLYGITYESKILTTKQSVIPQRPVRRRRPMTRPGRVKTVRPGPAPMQTARPRVVEEQEISVIYKGRKPDIQKKVDKFQRLVNKYGTKSNKGRQYKEYLDKHRKELKKYR